jgi:hypothetical protein
MHLGLYGRLTERPTKNKRGVLFSLRPNASLKRDIKESVNKEKGQIIKHVLIVLFTAHIAARSECKQHDNQKRKKSTVDWSLNSE